MPDMKCTALLLLSLLLSSAVLAGCARDADVPVSTDTDTRDTVQQTASESVGTTAVPTETASATELVTETETEAVTEPPAPPILRVSFAGVGDAIVHEGIWMEAQKTARLAGNGAQYDFSHLFTEVRDALLSYDLTFVNQETLMAGAEYGYSAYPRFNTPRELAGALQDVGFDVVNIANNHMMDMLPEGLAATIDFWDTQDVTLIGGYRDREDYNTPRIVEQNGIRIAFLSYCYGTNGLSMPAGYDMVIPYLDEDVIKEQTAAAEEMADFTVVSVHWGEDSYQALTEQQKTFAQVFADCGVDVVLGHHPHLIQPIQWIEGSDGNQTLCAYSLGNFFSLMAKAENMVGALLELDFVKEGADCRIENVVFRPTMFYYNMGFFGQKILFFENYTETLAAGHGVQNYAAANNKTAAELLSYIQSLIDDEFLPEVLRAAP